MVGKIKVLFVASECTPIAKVGGLGDVIGSLPKALAELGVEVKIALPFYESIDREIWKPKRLFDLDKETSVWRTWLPKSSVEVFLIYNKKYLSTGPVYFEKTAFAGSKKEIDRFVFFSQAVYQLLTRPQQPERTRIIRTNNRKLFGSFGWNSDILGRFDVVHCNDWHTGALVKLLKSKEIATPSATLTRQSGAGLAMTEERPKAVFTIHNLANQGAMRGTNWMAEGIKNADIVTTVSETYAKEIQTKKFGAGLEDLLKKRAHEGKLVGILNGIDYEFWRPRKRDKLQFQQQLGLRQDRLAPLFGLVSRLTYQKGLRMLLPLIEKFVRQGAQFVFLGQGELKNEKTLAAIAKKYPQNVFTKIGFDEKLAHQIYAQSDFFLMPSIFEPSGLGQMISMHYGTVPIVRATGGLKDSVRHLKTGFVFQKASVTDLKKTMELAAQYFYDKKKFTAIRQNCLRQDFSWSRSARKYREVYKHLLSS